MKRSVIFHLGIIVASQSSKRKFFQHRYLTILTISPLLILLVFFSSNLNAQSCFKIGAGSSYNFLIGSFGSSYINAASADLLVAYKTRIPGLELTLRGGYARYKYDRDYLQMQVSRNFPSYHSGTIMNWNAMHFPIMAGVKYSIIPGYVSPYIMCEAGIHIMYFDERFVEGTVNYDPFNQTIPLTTGITEKKTSAGFGFSSGTGIEITVDRKVNIDLGISCNYVNLKFANKYTVIKDENSRFVSDQRKDIPFFNVRAGVSYNL